MDSFNRLPAELLWSMPSDERCWVNLSHLLLTGNIWDVPGPGTWEVGWSELFSQVTPGLGSTFSIHFFHWDSVRFCEILYPPGFAGLAWMLQHAETLLPMAGEIQAELNSHTAGVSDIHAWGLMLPSSSRVSPITYHSVVAVRYPDLCRLMSSRWELGSFASGGIASKPPGYQFILWDTNAKINGLVAADLAP